jgi:hypothetical protein
MAYAIKTAVSRHSPDNDPIVKPCESAPTPGSARECRPSAGRGLWPRPIVPPSGRLRGRLIAPVAARRRAIDVFIARLALLGHP